MVDFKEKMHDMAEDMQETISAVEKMIKHERDFHDFILKNNGKIFEKDAKEFKEAADEQEKNIKALKKQKAALDKCISMFGDEKHCEAFQQIILAFNIFGDIGNEDK